MNIQYISPSYKREIIHTGEYLTKLRVFATEEDCKKIKTDIHKEIMPSDKQGKGKAIACNYILGTVWQEEPDAIILMDDDIKRVMMRENGEAKEIDENDFYTICENLVTLAREWGCGMFTFNRFGADRLCYNPAIPFSLHKLGTGCLMGFVKNDGIRFDERFLTNEDMDIQLEELRRYHKMLVVNRLFVDVGQWSNAGGYQEIRNGTKQDKIGRKMLQEKWGENIIRVNTKQKKGVSYSTYVPLIGE